MANITKNGRAHVIEMANRASVQKLAGESLSGLTTRLDNHESGLNHSAHIIANVAGLQTELDNKAYIDDVNTALDTKADIDVMNTALDTKADAFTGYTGTLTVIKTINFGAQTTTTATLNITNGTIVSIT